MRHDAKVNQVQRKAGMNRVLGSYLFITPPLVEWQDGLRLAICCKAIKYLKTETGFQFKY